MARGGVKACGAGAAARCSGVGWSGGSATASGATSDVLAALYLPEGQAEQPVLQLESHAANVSQPESQLESHEERRGLPLQPVSQPSSHEAGVSLRTSKARGEAFGEE